ncbi:MAG: lactonase family protein [Pyrinomonadaceae bacterium MAG19_C2-C3]|nr:lactonase family protein [Pyrinomonadaceae bacterium MAG19_C2-C3]
MKSASFFHPCEFDSHKPTTLFRQSLAVFMIVAMLGFAIPLPVLASDDDDARRGGGRVETIYVQSNNPLPNRNAILAYRHRNNGSLELVGTYRTRGTGAFNPTDRLGTDDHDQEIIASPDNRFLFTVNQGSNTIAVFRIESNGDLRHVNGSPFHSGGIGPVSLALSGNKLYVANQNENGAQPSFVGRPNYSVFNVALDGSLTRDARATINLPRGSTPTQVIVSPDGDHLFANQFFAEPYTPQLAPFLPARSSLLDSFNIRRNGRLDEASGSPFALTDEAAPNPAIPFPPPFPQTDARISLGLQVHPTRRILYVGFLLGFGVGVYTYNNNGVLNFRRVAPLADAGICWIVINKDQTRAYASNAISNSVSVLDISDPLFPVQIQSVALRVQPDAPPGPFGPVNFATTPFQIALDPDSETLYVKNHETITPEGDAKFDPREGYAEGNALHFLNIQANGMLVEHPRSPEFLPIPPGAHASGVLVLEQRNSRRQDMRDR